MEAEKQSEASFSELVTQGLEPERRELWAPIADNFERDGPDAAKTYLDAELDRLQGSVRSLLEEFNRR